MKFLAHILAWLAFVIGLPQMAFAVWTIWSGGWRMALVFGIFIALPVAPALLRERPGMRPWIPCVVAIVSIGASMAFWASILRGIPKV